MIENKIKTVKQKFGIVGNSTSLNHAIEVAIQVAPTDMSVLISGESGSGKESFSKIIHSMSKRKHGGRNMAERVRWEERVWRDEVARGTSVAGGIRRHRPERTWWAPRGRRATLEAWPSVAFASPAP